MFNIVGTLCLNGEAVGPFDLRLIHKIQSAGENMGFRFIIGSICSGFLLGVLFVRLLFGPEDSLLTFELYIFELRYGICSATIIGLIACCIDGFIWFLTKEKKPNVILKIPTPPMNK